MLPSLEREGVPLTGQGSPELVALLGCEPAVVESLLGVDPAAAPTETRDCVVAELGAWIAGLPLKEASIFFEAATPPADLVQQVAQACELGEAEVESLLGG